MPKPEFRLCYSVSTRTIPSCWSILTRMDHATAEMDDLFAMSIDPITSVWVEQWEGGILKETVHLYPDCAAEALAS